MRLLRPAACVLAAVAPVLAFAQGFTVSPANPTPLDTVTVRKPYGDADFTLTRISMSGNRITVKLRSTLGFPEPPPGTLTQPIGKFPAGTYQVEVVYVDAAGQPTSSLGTTSFTVAPRAAGQPVDDYSDIWWNPAESGWGLNLAQHADGQMFGTWFVYAADGTPTWYVMPGGHWASPLEFDGDIYRTTGPMLGTTFDPAAVTRTKVGTAMLLFFVDGQLIANFTIDGKQVVKTLHRQSF